MLKVNYLLRNHLAWYGEESSTELALLVGAGTNLGRVLANKYWLTLGLIRNLRE